MGDKTFGSYLRSLRKKQVPPMSQEKLAEAVGRGKMTISQFENGKNAPPQGSLLIKIVQALDLTPEEKRMLIFLSSEERQTIPTDISIYFYNNPSICELIRIGQANELDNTFWSNLLELVRKDYGKENKGTNKLQHEASKK